MGVRIITNDSEAVMYSSSTDWAFGPVFYADDGHAAEERVESFIRWLSPVDPREPSDTELERKYSEWRAQESEQWKREEKVEEESDMT